MRTLHVTITLKSSGEILDSGDIDVEDDVSDVYICPDSLPMYEEGLELTIGRAE